MTQRKPNPYFIRASAPRRRHAPAGRLRGEGAEIQAVITIADDFAFGHEQMAGFQRVFEDAAAAS